VAGTANKRKHPSWGFEHGDDIGGGRLALGHLGGGPDLETWLGWDPHLFSIVVLKLVRPHLAADEGTRRNLEREASVLGALAHPIIVRCFDVVASPPRPHLVLEHLDGPHLRGLIRRFGPNPLEQLLPLALHIASAVHYMHACGYVHLDIKPRNLVIGPQPRLIDMSLARTVESAGRTGPGVGTPSYMAPEQCDPGRFGPVGPPSDVWGLGATLYEAITGRGAFSRPRRGDDGRWDYPQVREPMAADFPRYTPTRIREVVAAALAPEPADRPTPAELVLALEPVVAGLPPLSAGKRGFRYRS
jgi:serine/threonine protein kinase